MKIYDNLLTVREKKPELWNDWHWQLKNSMVSVKKFISAFGISEGLTMFYKEITKKYPVRIPPYYLLLSGLGNKPLDSVLMQCFPHIAEIKKSSDNVKDDPFDEKKHIPVPGIIQRYEDRLVLLVSDVCAMNCRHCTRKNILGKKIALHTDEQFEVAFDYIKNNPAVREVIVSGGDPLMLETERLDYILGRLTEIDSVDVLRIGTRVPVVLPMRIDDELCDMLSRHRPIWINTQFNHPAEITEDAIRACDKMLRAGLPVSNQAVLLKDVNDNIDTMRELCLKLQKNMIRPYYVFQCDPVIGVEHFMTDIKTGIENEQQLRQSVGGLALPRFVADMPDTRGKVPLTEICID